MSFIPEHLTVVDARSPAMENLLKDLEARLAALREENDSSSDVETTAKRRGRIAECKEWLALIRQTQQAEDTRFKRVASFPPQFNRGY